jgi:hypothetical protein
MTDEVKELTAEELIGTAVDLIIDKFGPPNNVEIIGRNADGLVVEWHYDKFKLTFARAIGEEPINKNIVSLYVVTQVEFTKEKRDGRKRHKSKG